MKKPFFNSDERLHIIHNTHKGAELKLMLAIEKLKREIYRENNIVEGFLKVRKLMRTKIT